MTDWRLGFFSGAVPAWESARVAHAAQAAGFDGLEWDCGTASGHIRLPSYADDAPRRKHEAAAVGLPVCALSAAATVSVLDRASVAALLEACVLSGAPLARVFAPPFDAARPVEEQLAAVAHALRAHAAYLQAHALRLVIELSEETLIPSPELLRRVCGDLDAALVGGLYDPANMRVEGHLDPAYAVRLLGPYLHHVHAKNEIFVAEAGRWRPTVVPLDQGLVAWPQVFAALRQVDYGGWVVLDHLSAEPSEARLREEGEMLRSLSRVGGGAAGPTE